MRIRWTVPAADDLANIKEYLQQQYPQFAERTVRSIYKRIRSLKASPWLGRPGSHGGTRELPLAPYPYIVIYRVTSEVVEILRIHHGAQNRRLM